MKNHFILFLCFSSLISNGQSTNFEWVRRIAGFGSQITTAITTDDLGNVYTIGIFENITEFNGVTGSETRVAGYQADIFVQKLDANGNFLWVKQMGGNGECFGASITVDTHGNIYATGYFKDTIDFDPSSGIQELISKGGSDLFVQKLDASGNLQWVRQFGGIEDDIGSSIEVDTNDNIFITGYFNDTVDFDPGTSELIMASNGNRDIFIQKLDSNGNLIWAKQMGGVGFENGVSLALDPYGNVYSTGTFSSETDFDPGIGETKLNTVGNFDFYIQKLDSSGNFQWVKHFGGVASEVAYSLTTDNLGNVYSTGYFSNSIDFDPGVNDETLISTNGLIFVLKLDTNGDYVWVKQMGNNNQEMGYAISVDPSGNVYSTGKFEHTVDFDPSTGVTNLTSNGSADIYIQKLNANGDFLWVNQIGSNGFEIPYAIETDASSNIYTCGTFRSNVPVDFDPGTGISNLLPINYDDSYILKLSSTSIGIPENGFGNDFLVYPNPNNGEFSIDLGKTFSSVQITMTDLTGRVLRSIDITNGQLINLSLNQPQGIYLLTVQSQNEKATFKLVKN